MRRRTAATLLSLAACTWQSRAPLLPAPTVEMIGCLERRVGPVCEVTPSKSAVTFWVDTPNPHKLSLRIDDRPLPLGATTPVQGGLRFEVIPPDGVLAIEVEGHQPSRVRFVAHPPGPNLAEVTKLRHAGDLDAADALLDRIVATGTVAGALGQRARNWMARGKNERAREAFEASIREHERAGRVKSLVADLGALNHLLVERGFPPGDARAALAELEVLARDDTWASLWYHYGATTRAVRRRDPRAGLHHVRTAIALNDRLGRNVIDLRQYRIFLLRLTGRWRELAEELERLRLHLADDTLSACQRAQVLNNLGWHTLLGRQQAPDHFAGRKLDELRESAKLYRTKCPMPHRRFNAELNAGWAALFEENFDGAREHLDAARAAVAQPDVTSRLNLEHLTAAWVARTAAPARAVESFARLARLAQELQALDVEWQAHLARGRSEEARGDLAAAAAAYHDAQAALQGWARRVPLGEGRDTLLAKREDSAVALVETLSRLGRGEAAIAAIREIIRGNAAWARQRSARREGGPKDAIERLQVEVRNARADLDAALERAWTLPASALPEVERSTAAKVAEARRALDALFQRADHSPLAPLRVHPGEALVFAHPGRTGLHAWVQKGEGLTYVATASTAAGLASVGEALVGAERVRIYAHPGLVALPWDTIDVDGSPLFRRAAIVFHADLGPLPARKNSTRTALIVADPTGELPTANAEAQRVAASLEARDFAVETIQTEVTVPRLSAALRRRPELFHYSGHGIQLGLDGLDGGFPLGGDRRFEVVDVLSLGGGPRRVVLAACDLGSRDTAAFSMAQAFLVEGAEVVVAAVRPVDDAHTSRWVDAFYTSLRSHADWGSALRAARVSLADAQVPWNASAFRVWVRE
ncbi:MAG: CHAT domain-containing protein [Deltaproteobacteria bacterium]